MDRSSHAQVLTPSTLAVLGALLLPQSVYAQAGGESTLLAESGFRSAAAGFTSGAGDVNGDGFADLVLDTAGDGGYGFSLFLGSLLGPGSSPDWMDGTQRLAPLGDVNCDDRADLLATSATGQAIYYGAGTFPLSPVAITALPGARAVGDLNGDGCDDVVTWEDVADGKVSLYLGSPGGLSTESAWSATGAERELTESEPLFGARIAGAGDVNGDGYGDLLVGTTYKEDDPYSSGGRVVFLFSGTSEGLSDEPVWQDWGCDYNSHHFELAPVGDVDHDGYGDLAIGEPRGSNGGCLECFEGNAYVVRGRASTLPRSCPLVVAEGWMAVGRRREQYFGSSVSGAGDVNADGFDDVIVVYAGAYGSGGQAVLYLGSALGLSRTPGEMTGSRKGPDPKPDWLGPFMDQSGDGRVEGAGDVNGDGWDDVLVSNRGTVSGTAVVETVLYYGDGCPDDPDKVSPGVCGCGVAEGCSTDGGVADGGVTDGDAGMQHDAGGGPVDAGVHHDAGVRPDAGAPDDAGGSPSDAGPDAAVDAGPSVPPERDAAAPPAGPDASTPPSDADGSIEEPATGGGSSSCAITASQQGSAGAILSWTALLLTWRARRRRAEGRLRRAP